VECSLHVACIVTLLVLLLSPAISAFVEHVAIEWSKLLSPAHQVVLQLLGSIRVVCVHTTSLHYATHARTG